MARRQSRPLVVVGADGLDCHCPKKPFERGGWDAKQPEKLTEGQHVAGSNSATDLRPLVGFPRSGHSTKRSNRRLRRGALGLAMAVGSMSHLVGSRQEQLPDSMRSRFEKSRRVCMLANRRTRASLATFHPGLQVGDARKSTRLYAFGRRQHGQDQQGPSRPASQISSYLHGERKFKSLGRPGRRASS